MEAWVGETSWNKKKNLLKVRVWPRPAKNNWRLRVRVQRLEQSLAGDLVTRRLPFGEETESVPRRIQGPHRRFRIFICWLSFTNA